MFELFYLLYYALIGSAGHFLISKAFQDLNENEKKVRFKKKIIIIYFNKVENKEEYWYSIDDFIRFSNDFLENNNI